MSDGPSPGNVIAGVFLILFGLCITLLGGGCTLLVLAEFRPGADSGMLFFLALSLVILGGGVSLLWVGFRLVTGKMG